MKCINTRSSRKTLAVAPLTVLFYTEPFVIPVEVEQRRHLEETFMIWNG